MSHGNYKGWSRDGKLINNFDFEYGLKINPIDTNYNYLTYTPSDYYKDITKTYPLIIYKGLRKESYNEMFKEHIKVPATEYDYLPHPDKLAWGLGFGIKNLQFGKMYFHEGLNHGFQSYFMMDKENKRGYVFFTNCQNADEFMYNLEIFLTEGNNKTAK
jgi:CubicO group peptidase (beta-lactamase class C family)